MRRIDVDPVPIPLHPESIVDQPAARHREVETIIRVARMALVSTRDAGNVQETNCIFPTHHTYRFFARQVYARLQSHS